MKPTNEKSRMVNMLAMPFNKGWVSGQKRKSVKTMACVSGNLVRK